MWISLWPGGPKLQQAADAFPLSLDAVALAAFTHTAGAKRCMDLGCGDGILLLLLGARAAALELHGIEIQAAWAERCRENLAENGFSRRSCIHTGNLRNFTALGCGGSFDLVVSNPPYFPAGAGRHAPNPSRALARTELACTFSDLCAAAAYFLAGGGRFTLIHRPERLPELMAALSGAGLEPKRLRFIHHDAGHAPSLVLLEARKGARPGLDTLPPLLLYTEQGAETAEYRKLFHLEETP